MGATLTPNEIEVLALLRDKTRPARVPKLADEIVEHVVALTLSEPRVRQHAGLAASWWGLLASA